MSMVINLVEDHNIYLCEGGPVYNGGVQPTPITYLTQWKIVGNSEVHTDPYLTQWKVEGNSVVDNNIILSCGDLEQDGKYHVKISNGVDIYDIALTEPLRKVNDVVDTIAFPSSVEGKALVTRAIGSVDLGRDMSWNFSSSSNRMFSGTDIGCKYVSTELVANMLCSVYNTISNDDTLNGIVGIATQPGGTGAICVYDDNYNTSESRNDFVAHLQGVELIYELATPTTELVDVPQIAVSPTNTYTSANVVPYSAFEHTENKEIWSCGEYSAVDGKYHILVQPQGGSIADIALDEPLRKVNSVADSIEFQATLEAFTDADGNQIVTTLPDDTILHIQNLYDYTQITRHNVAINSISQRSTEVRVQTVTGASYLGFGMTLQGGKYYTSCLFKNEDAKPNIIYSNSGNSPTVSSSDYQKTSLLQSNVTTLRYSALNNPTGVWQVNDVFFVKDINIFDIDAMFADCTDLKPASTSNFENLFPNLGCIDRTDTAIDVIVKDGKLYKYVETEGNALVTRNFASVDMGSLIWDMVEISSSGYFRFRTHGIRSTAKGAPNNQSAPNALIARYDAISSDEVYYRNTGFTIDSHGIILGYDPDYNQSDSAAAFKTAMDGVELIYELRTPTTELVDAPQIEEADSYSMVISQGTKAVEWSSFETE